MSDSLQLHELQCAGLPRPSLSSGVCSKSCPLSQWCYYFWLGHCLILVNNWVYTLITFPVLNLLDLDNAHTYQINLLFPLLLFPIFNHKKQWENLHSFPNKICIIVYQREGLYVFRFFHPKFFIFLMLPVCFPLIFNWFFWMLNKWTCNTFVFFMNFYIKDVLFLFRMTYYII